MKAGDIVKYSNPEPGEESFRFVLLEHNGDRVSIQLICDHRIKPVEVVSPDEIEPAAATAVSPIDALLSRLRKGPNRHGFVVNLTDGELEAPTDPEAPVEMVIYPDLSAMDQVCGCRNFANATEAFEFFAAMRDALIVLEQLTAEDITYAVDKARGESMGFAALHDRMDANMLLPDGATQGNWMERANAIIDAFNALVLGDALT